MRITYRMLPCWAIFFKKLSASLNSLEKNQSRINFKHTVSTKALKSPIPRLTISDYMSGYLLRANQRVTLKLKTGMDAQPRAI